MSLRLVIGGGSEIASALFHLPLHESGGGKPFHCCTELSFLRARYNFPPSSKLHTWITHERLGLYKCCSKSRSTITFNIQHRLPTWAKMELLTAQKVNIICPEGDILLRGAYEGNRDLLLASSHVLSKASESLTRMLQTPRAPRPRSFAFTNEIKLPEDDGDALLIICNILHGRDRYVPDTLPLGLLKEVAQSCSRYQLTSALLPWSPRWIDHAIGIALEDELYTIIAIALDLGINLTRDKPISCRSQQPFSIVDPGLAGAPKLFLLCRYAKLIKMHTGGLHYQKTQVMLKAVAALRNCSLDLYYISPKCTEGHLAVWEAQLESRGLLPFERAVQTCNLSGLMEALRTLEVPNVVPGCGCRGFAPSLPQDLRDAVCQTLDTTCPW
jgi:hypothetical protein